MSSFLNLQQDDAGRTESIKKSWSKTYSPVLLTTWITIILLMATRLDCFMRRSGKGVSAEWDICKLHMLLHVVNVVPDNNKISQHNNHHPHLSMIELTMWLT